MSATVTVNFNNCHFLLLYCRYGENVTEANINPKWTCPSCREICNCNSCRRKNGWLPTGNIYNKVSGRIWHFNFVPSSLDLSLQCGCLLVFINEYIFASHSSKESFTLIFLSCGLECKAKIWIFWSWLFPFHLCF